MIGLIGKNLGQTRVYDAQGNLVQVTLVRAGPNRVVQCKTAERDGYQAVQLGFDDQKEKRVRKPELGHLKKHQSLPVKRIREFRDFSLAVKAGDSLNVDLFSPGDFVDAIGTTKGRGFQGVVKRYRYRGGDGSHGAKGFLRRPGSISPGATPGHVYKGKCMPGHMGQVRRTVQNLEIIQVHPQDHVLAIKGSIPGARGDYVIIRESKKHPKLPADEADK